MMTYILIAIAALCIVGVICYRVGRSVGNSAERERQQEIREQTRRLKQEMTGNIAHELRTPVTSIRGFLEIVLGNEGLDHQRREEYLHRAYGQTHTLSELISDMSLLARIDEKQGAFEFVDVDVTELLEKVLSDASAALAEKNISFQVDIPQGLVLKANQSLLYSVFRNLTDNVVAHAGENIEIRVGAVDKGGRMVRFTFADTGRGIPDGEHLERLFERFYRVSEGRTRAAGGSGLGLSIVKNTIELHGGTISVKNGKESGLEFTFSLPAR